MRKLNLMWRLLLSGNSFRVAMWQPVMAFVEVIVIGLGFWGGWSGWFAILDASTFNRGCYPPYTNSLSKCDTETVTVSAAFLAHASWKQREIKAALILTRVLQSVDSWSNLNWLKRWDRGKDFWWEQWRWLYKHAGRIKMAEV